MASRRRSAPVRPSHWFLNLGKVRARERARLRVSQGMLAPEDVSAYVNAAGLRARLSTREYLSKTVKDLRRYFTGFEARDGYNIQLMHTWDAKREKTVRQYGSYLHHLQSSPFVDVSPKRYHGAKRALFKRQLRLRTGQGLKRQKRYVFHVEQTERPTDVRMTRAGQLEVREEFKKTYFTRRYWYFRDYLHGRQPQTFRDIVKALTRMLPDLPDDLWYTIIDTSHGPIDVPVRKEFLIATLMRYQSEYASHEGFAESLLGVMFAGSREEAMAGYNERLARRMRAQYARSERAKITRRRLAFQRRAGRVR